MPRRENDEPTTVLPTEGGLPPSVGVLWRRFLAARPEARDRGPYDASSFEDDAATADECAALVLADVKTATSGLLWRYEEEGLPLPGPGALHVVLTSRGEAVCTTETREVRVLPFRAVDASLARGDGEGDPSLAGGRGHMWPHFARACARRGREPSEEMPLVCKRFRVVFRE
jgi:uncharacterized protein YhfF